MALTYNQRNSAFIEIYNKHLYDLGFLEHHEKANEWWYFGIEPSEPMTASELQEIVNKMIELNKESE